MNNLSYETAVSLKKAGFPQTGARDWYCGGHTYYGLDPEGEYEECEEKEILNRDDRYCESAGMVAEFPIEVPSLSELIDAIWSKEPSTFHLYGHEHILKWMAQWTKDSAVPTSSEGSTPEEAVANLYLALHNK